MTFLLPPGIKGLNKFKKIKAYIISITHTVQKIHAQSICLRLVLHYDNCRWNRSTETEFVWFPFTGVLNWCQIFVLLWVFYFVEFFLLLWLFSFILLWVLYFVVSFHFYFVASSFFSCNLFLLLCVFYFLVIICFSCECLLLLLVFYFVVSFCYCYKLFLLLRAFNFILQRVLYVVVTLSVAAKF